MEPDDEDAEVNREVAQLTFQGADDDDDEGSRGIEIIEEKLMKNFVIPRADVFGRRRSSSEGSQDFYDDVDDDFQDDVFSEGSEVDDDLLDETEGGKDTIINEAQVRMDNCKFS